MKRAKQEKLKKRGWAVGTVADFLALTPEEAAFVEIKLALSDALRTQRQKANLSQAQVASKLASSQSRVAKMEKNARILSIIAHISPLIGLLGTVLGFIRAFGEMRMSSLVEISSTQIGEAMEYALVTTAAGLVVAIPAVLAYNYIVSRVEGITVEIQATAAEVVDLLTFPATRY